MKKLLTAVGAVLALSLSPIVFASPADNEAQTVAHAMVNRFVDSWNRADGVAYGENYWPEAELVDPLGRIASGQPAIVREHVEMWAGLLENSFSAQATSNLVIENIYPEREKSLVGHSGVMNFLQVLRV